MRMPPLKLHRFTRLEYERLVERGAFGPDDRVELLDGLLVVRGPACAWPISCPSR
jgi:hypothetical protein